jgi:6-pyruvoyltetrahydropterin/6-carboxytetrahydropterin synthase
MLSLFVFNFVAQILACTQTNNGEGNIEVKSVRYHETTTGYAECDVYDWQRLYCNKYNNIVFSNGIIKDWSNELLDLLINSTVVQNPIIEQQINLNPVVKSSETEKLEEVVEEVVD